MNESKPLDRYSTKIRAIAYGPGPQHTRMERLTAALADIDAAIGKMGDKLIAEGIRSDLWERLANEADRCTASDKPHAREIFDTAAEHFEGKTPDADSTVK